MELKLSKFSLNKTWLVSIGQFLGLAVIFGLSYIQDSLYSGNQTTKFVHGLAQAGFGFLKNDWFANTIDPLPAFTFLVGLTYTWFSPYMFYVYYILIFGLYLYSTSGIVSFIYKINSSKIKYLTYLTLIIAIHCIHIKTENFDSAIHLHSGVAEQYVLGPYFQPSNFGVFIIFSIYAFLQRRYYRAVLALTLAATFHPAYMLSAGIMTLVYMIIVYKNEGKLKQILSIGVLASISILPVFSYMYFTFRPTSPEIWEKAKELLVHIRIPHHSIPGVWLSDPNTYVQIALVIIALYLIRKTPVFPLLFLPFLAATSLTTIQVITNSNTLAFIAPWRISAFLVPISLCIIVGWLVSYLFEKYPPQVAMTKKAIAFLCITTLSVLVTVGTYNQIYMLLDPDGSIPMQNFVKETKQPGDTYLIPTKNKQLWKFRLYTGAPILINLKSHPYKDVEVMEWYNRNLMAQQFYEVTDKTRCENLNKISTDYRINKVVIEAENYKGECNFLKELYRDERYGVYQIQ